MLREEQEQADRQKEQAEERRKLREMEEEKRKAVEIQERKVIRVRRTSERKKSLYTINSESDYSVGELNSFIYPISNAGTNLNLSDFRDF